MEGRLEKPSDILTVKEAIDLINTDTRTNPVVDNRKLIKNVEYLRSNFRGGGMNFTIFLVKRDEDGKIVPNGKKWAAITSHRDQTELEYAITDHYKALSGKDIDPEQIGLYKRTTAVDPGSGNTTGLARNNPSSKLSYGDELGSSPENQTVQEY